MRINPPLLAAGLLLSLTALNAEATLTPYTSAGQSLVYSSISNITWTGDGNLLGSLITSQGYNNVVSQIASITPTYNDPVYGLQTIDAGDFNTADGRMSWWGAQAFINYLNNINYGGSTQWRLPTSKPINVYKGNPGNELGQLFYSELGGTAGYNTPNTFKNVQASEYWSSAEYASHPGYAWTFGSSTGYQYGYQYGDNGSHVEWYTWAVSPGQVSAVPVPGAVWLFGAGLLGLLGLKRRGHAG